MSPGPLGGRPAPPMSRTAPLDPALLQQLVSAGFYVFGETVEPLDQQQRQGLEGDPDAADQAGA